MFLSVVSAPFLTTNYILYVCVFDKQDNDNSFVTKLQIVFKTTDWVKVRSSSKILHCQIPVKTCSSRRAATQCFFFILNLMFCTKWTSQMKTLIATWTINAWIREYFKAIMTLWQHSWLVEVTFTFDGQSLWNLHSQKHLSSSGLRLRTKASSVYLCSKELESERQKPGFIQENVQMHKNLPARLHGCIWTGLWGNPFCNWGKKTFTDCPSVIPGIFSGII